MKKPMALLLALCLLLGALPLAQAEDERPMERADYLTYLMDLDTTTDALTPLYYFDGVADLPWISAEDMCDLVSSIATEALRMEGLALDYSLEGHVATLTRETKYTMTIDFDADTVTFDDFNAFLSAPTEGTLLDPMPYVGDGEDGMPQLFRRDMEASFDRYGEEIVLDLAERDIHLIFQDGRGFIPLQFMNDFLLEPLACVTAQCNGEALYVISAEALEDENGLTPLGEKYYSVQPAERSQALADYGYNELCLMMDSLYGLKEKHDIQSFADLFRQVAFEEDLRSPDPGVADMAITGFIRFFLDDSHSGYLKSGWMAGNLFLEGQNGPSHEFILSQMDQYGKLRTDALGEDFAPYLEVGNTAYITFDRFAADYSPQEYFDSLESGESVPDTIGLIIDASRQINRENSPIENVVIDLTHNGGGDVDAAMFLASWILGKAELSIADAFTHAQSTMVYRADVNLDHEFTEADTLAGRHVYCLISPASFSCGNLVPSMCKKNQAVTLIGRTSGGGACIVQPVSTAWGTLLQISGPLRLSFRRNGSFYDADQGIDPDIYIDRLETLYDREALTDLINTLH